MLGPSATQPEEELMKRLIPFLLAAVILAFGLAVLNYTKASTFEQKTTWAQEKGMPAPDDTLFRVGVGGTVLGSVLLGFTLRGRRKD
jgi:hypothetical protein